MYSILIGCLLSGDAPVGTDGDRLIVDVFRERKAITSAKMVLNVETVTDEHELKTTLYSIWMDKDQIRIDRQFPKSKTPENRTVVCKNCEKPGFSFFWTQELAPSGAPRLAQFQANGKCDFAGLLFDPRLLGLIATYLTVIHNYHLDAELGSTQRRDFHARTDVVEGEPCTVVDFTLDIKSKPKFQYWVLQTPVNRVARIICDSGNGESTFKETLEVRSKRYGDSKLWFPWEYLYTRVIDGKKAGQEKVHFLELELNKPVDPAVFTLKGIGIPIGTPIHSRDENARGYTFQEDGLRVVQNAGGDHSLPTVRYGPNPRRPWLLASSIGFTVVALGSLVIYIRIRRIKGRGGCANQC